ncbi:MAG: DotU family type IV/VI secretion system protein [Gemmatimonadaceae bacterium]|nr:DotU family type IV/VI secretion system protein [Gemmatimonadaceae bacterium]
MATIVAPLPSLDGGTPAPESTPRSPRRGQLARTLDPVFLLAARLRASREAATDAAPFRKHVIQLLRTAEQQAITIGYARPDVRAGLYAAIVFLDEVVLNTRPLFGDWARRPLQEEVFGEHMGGEAFFTALDAQLARPDSEDTGDVLEVYQLCLLLGFHGRHANQDGELAGRSTRIARKLERIRGPMISLAPHWALPATDVVPPRHDPLARKLRTAALVALAVTFVLFITYRLLLANDAGTWRELAAMLARS